MPHVAISSLRRDFAQSSSELCLKVTQSIKFKSKREPNSEKKILWSCEVDNYRLFGSPSKQEVISKESAIFCMIYDKSVVDHSSNCEAMLCSY